MHKGLFVNKSFNSTNRPLMQTLVGYLDKKKNTTFLYFFLFLNSILLSFVFFLLPPELINQVTN